MTTESMTHAHIAITETWLRLYVFLTQHLDRSQHDCARATYPEDELQTHLASTRSEMMDILAVNQVVRRKVDEECSRVLAIGGASLRDRSGGPPAITELKAERTALQHKTMALSDLLAVFRAKSDGA